jgi:predicted enzyme related to lactoylglutathione lyase
MKPEFHGLRTTIYKVGDINQAKAWYSQVLGIQPYFDEPFYVGFNVGGYELGLQPEEGQTTKGGVATYWGVSDVKKTYEKLLSQGATVHENPTDVGEKIIVAAVKDPWGNIFGIIDNPHFKIAAS